MLEVPKVLEVLEVLEVLKKAARPQGYRAASRQSGSAAKRSVVWAVSLPSNLGAFFKPNACRDNCKKLN